MTPKPTAYDRELIAEMLEEYAASRSVDLRHTRASIADQITLLRAADNAESRADTVSRAAEGGDAVREALVVAEAALADIGDADREPGDDVAWCERRAAQALPKVRAALAAQPGAGDGPIVRFNDDGTLDEVVGIGQFHLEQMGATHWWMQLGPHMVNLHSKATIKANFSRNEAQGGGDGR